ncbi:hypothetical protein G6K87_23740 [Agrobacterium tumefaciens]|uniref:hypothetical protein n=1 Tax=Agrobacterium tumefaciens TaxID=358 RepID=UPI00157320CB|nr:hypothetical protein [Agrobacterium tumefaciens]
MNREILIGLVGLPYDANSSFLQGPRLAPEKIREMLRSEHWNLTTENGVDLEAEIAGENALREARQDVVMARIGEIAELRQVSHSMVAYKLYREGIIDQAMWSSVTAIFRQQWLNNKAVNRPPGLRQRIMVGASMTHKMR